MSDEEVGGWPMAGLPPTEAAPEPPAPTDAKIARIGPATCGPRRRAIVSTRTAARFDALLPFEVWRELGVKMSTYSNASAWWLGDWLIFGRMKYGRRYKDAI